MIAILNDLKQKIQQDNTLLPSDNPRHYGPFSTKEQIINSSLKSMEALLNILDMNPNQRYLDYGCGIGRMAMPFSKYLANGSYTGVDIVPDAIADCRKRFGKLAHFDFHHLNMFNSDYNTKGLGSKDAFASFSLSKQFDKAFCFSVFSHLLPEDLDDVLQFLFSVMAKGSELMFTMYIMTEAAEAYDGKSKIFTFPHKYKEAFIQVQNNPSRAVAYRPKDIEAYIKASGFTIKQINYGKWSGNAAGFTFQDNIVLTK